MNNWALVPLFRLRAISTYKPACRLRHGGLNVSFSYVELTKRNYHLVLRLLHLLQIDLFNFHSKGSVICKLTLIFAAAPLNKNAELLADLQKEVSAGKVGYFTVDKSRPVNVEPDEGKMNIKSRGKKRY